MTCMGVDTLATMLVKSSIVSSSLCERVREARRGREEEKRNLLNLLQPK